MAQRSLVVGSMLMLVLGRQQSSSASKLDQVSLLHGLRMVEKSNMNRKVAEPDLHVLEIVVCLVWLWSSHRVLPERRMGAPPCSSTSRGGTSTVGLP